MHACTRELALDLARIGQAADQADDTGGDGEDNEKAHNTYLVMTRAHLGVGGIVMPKQPKPKKSDDTNQQTPEREDVEAEVPQAPAKEPMVEPEPLGGGSRAPRPTIEPEVE